MPLPKRRHSNQRTRLRRTHYKLKLPTVSECPRCHAPRRSYHVCPACGLYNGRIVTAKIIKVKKAAGS